MAYELNVSSLRHALEAAVAAPAAPRSVTVISVHLSQAGALLSFCEFQSTTRDLWYIRNFGRLICLAAIDSYLSAMVALIQLEPISTHIMRLLGRYAICVRDSASYVGEGFVEAVAPIMDGVVELADSARLRPALVSEVEFLDRIRRISGRLQVFRSGQVPLAAVDSEDDTETGGDTDTDTTPTCGDEEEEDDMGNLNLLSLGETLNYATVNDQAIDRRVTVYALRVSDSAALFAVIQSMHNWRIRNLNSVTDITLLDAAFHAMERELLHIVRERPDSQPALDLLRDYTSSLARRIASVGGGFATDATNLCNSLIAHAKATDLSEHQMSERIRELHTRVSDFRASQVTIDSSRDSSASSSSSS